MFQTSIDSLWLNLFFPIFILLSSWCSCCVVFFLRLFVRYQFGTVRRNGPWLPHHVSRNQAIKAAGHHHHVVIAVQVLSNSISLGSRSSLSNFQQFLYYCSVCFLVVTIPIFFSFTWHSGHMACSSSFYSTYVSSSTSVLSRSTFDEALFTVSSSICFASLMLSMKKMISPAILRCGSFSPSMLMILFSQSYDFNAYSRTAVKRLGKMVSPCQTLLPTIILLADSSSFAVVVALVYMYSVRLVYL